LHDLDPRLAAQDVAKVLLLKQYLEDKGFYTLRSTHRDPRDPTASFLFGSLRGYCVHFAHAAVYLFRSQGIAARIALGYGVHTLKHGSGSAILIMGDRAHAWPEVYIEGVGWVAIDIYPKQTDMPPAPAVDYDLEKLFGELARKDKTGGISATGQAVKIPWRLFLYALTAVAWTMLLVLYLLKFVRRTAFHLRQGAAKERAAYLSLLDRLSDVGLHRFPGESREQHARRLEPLLPHFALLTERHLAMALGAPRADSFESFKELICVVDAELKGALPRSRRMWGLINPASWLWTR
jgi:hypothetical protein